MEFDVKSFEEAKRASVAQLLFKCARLLNEQAIDKVRSQAKLPNFRMAHTHLFPHIDLTGTRLTDLAARLGVSKQAVGQLVTELEAMGTLERIPDPTDGRAKLICFSEKGKLGLFKGMHILSDMDQELAGKIGRRQMAQLHKALLALETVLLEKSSLL